MYKIKQFGFLVTILIPLFGIGQTLEVNQSDLTIARGDKAVNKMIRISVKGTDPSEAGILTITETNSGTAVRNIDYSIIGPLKRLITDTATIVIAIKPNPSQKGDETIRLDLSVVIPDDGPRYAEAPVTVTIKPFTAATKPTGRQLYAIDSARVTILTAGSLSFFGSPQFAKYVGQLDIRLPSLLGEKKKWGFNAGVFTKNYNVDSVQLYRQVGHFNVRIPGNDTLYARKQYNRYANKVEYDVMGAYFNPTFLLGCNKDNSKASFRIYLNTSLEFLATTVKSTYNSYNLSDSVSMPYNRYVSQGSALAPNSSQIMPANAVVSQHIITGYYGLGTQLVYQQNNLVNLNLVFLSGYSVTGIENDTGVSNKFDNGSVNSHQWYYFAKGVITEKVTKLNATIGVEVRGFYPNNTGVAAYLGFLISPSDFFKK
jgi:hypothetical protein